MKNVKIPLLLAFSLSNAAALIYQIVWSRELGYIFGTSMYAITTVLASFMAGLAIGSFIFGRIIDRSRDPIRLFSYLQISIGAYGLAIIALFKFIPYFYHILYDYFSWNQQIFIFSLFILSFIVLIIPTTLMGSTFPVFSKIFNKDLERIGNDIGTIYGADTIGAFLGVVLGGFILMPLLGLDKTLVFAAMINIISGIYILRILSQGYLNIDSIEKNMRIHAKS